MTLKRPEETFVRTTGELSELWRDLMGADGFDFRSLWVIFLATSGELCPTVMPIDDLPDEPDETFLRNLADIARGIQADGLGSVAFLLSRPGPAEMLESDRRWARELARALGDELRTWPVHLATHGRVQVFAPDDLIAA
jgi:hypothetical protein